MRRLLIASITLLLAHSVLAFQPRTGHWWNSAESGRGFNIDIQDGVMVMTIYTYDSLGNAQWYLAAGPMGNGQHNFTATLTKYAGGQCVMCSYRPATVIGNDGVVTVAFATETLATVTFPGGRVTTIQPLNFAIGDPPTGLLGEWLFVEQIGTVSFADRFDFSTVIPGTSNGNGIAADPTRFAGCELQITGLLAGTVICADTDPAGNIENAYAFIFGLDETFSGAWIAPTTGAEYPMKGFNVISKSGFSKAALQDGAAAVKSGQVASTPADRHVSPEVLEAMRALGARLREARR